MFMRFMKFSNSGHLYFNQLSIAKPYNLSLTLAVYNLLQITMHPR